MTEPGTNTQLELLRSTVSAPPAAAKAAAPTKAAAVDPVASVLVDTGLAHLDRPFEYLVPPEWAEAAQPGVRVKVRFAGQDLDGFVLARHAEAEHPGRLTAIRRVVSAEPVLTPALLALCRAVAARYAGTLGDVVRLALPPRHATAERALALEPPTADPLPSDPLEPDLASAWSRFAAGPAYLTRLAAGESPAASWLALPSSDPATDWPQALAAATVATLASGRGSILVVPDHRDVER
ncbi:MAG TPA: primosome assembly protein PriA, partial [Pedococcus sp.]|nr:primosome assembly protein PriA [Pedococcus sp.]